MRNKWPGNPADVAPVAYEAPKEVSEIEHEAGEDGFLQYDVNTLEIQPTRWPHGPIKLPEQFDGVDQPFVGTCSRPTETNRGCYAHGGCPYKNYPYVGPFNIIVRRRKKTEFIPCYNYFHAKGRDGVRAATLSYKSEGFEIDTTRTTVEWDRASWSVGPNGEKIKKVEKVLVDVPNLGPMYDHLKKGTENGDHRNEAGKGPEVPRRPGNRGSGLLENPPASRRSGGKSDRKGSARPDRRKRLQRDLVEKAKPAGKETKEAGGIENHGSPRSSRRNLSTRRGSVPSDGVGERSDKNVDD